MNNQLDLFGNAPESKKPAKRSRNAARNSDAGELLRRIKAIEGRFDRVEHVLRQLYELLTVKQAIKDWYTTKEVASILEKKEYTVREWCRLERVNATKARCGRGAEQSWLISHDELTRYQNEGLLPPPERY